jgi:hypothetical protein
MSEQEGGILESGPSYQYNREGVKKYRGGAISSDKFYSWQQEHMYKSTYNQNHSYVSDKFIKRTQMYQRVELFLDIKVSSHLSDLKVCMPRGSLPFLKGPLIGRSWIRTKLA